MNIFDMLAKGLATDSALLTFVKEANIEHLITWSMKLINGRAQKEEASKEFLQKTLKILKTKI